MAKAVEDTVFYRYVRLVGLGEGRWRPRRFGVAVPEFHAFAERIAADWPLTMTTLSTHDTKRSEDVRARLAVLSERPAEWSAWVRKAWGMGAAHRDERVDPLTEYLLWQTVVGAWPISAERLVAYATKAVREAKLHTAWVAATCSTKRPWPVLHGHRDRRRRGPAHRRLAHSHCTGARANTLGQKVIRLLMPGVPDLYQGSDLVDLSLVDPDNRRPVDYREAAPAGPARCRGAAARTWPTRSSSSPRRRCGSGVSGPRSSSGPRPGTQRLATSEQPLASAADPVDRTTRCVVATRRAARLRNRGGWDEEFVTLPAGSGGTCCPTMLLVVRRCSGTSCRSMAYRWPSSCATT